MYQTQTSHIDLSKHKKEFLFIPLGGSNEIGMNLNLYHYEGKYIIIDMGVGFAYDIPGVQMLCPDITFLKKIRNHILAIVITHIHEDHIGAVQYLWGELKIPVFASKLAGNFLRSKLAEFKLDKIVKINEIKNDILKLGPFTLDFIGLTHSVPEMKAVVITTEKGNILHTGDWKFDDNPVVGEDSDKRKIKHYASKFGFLALVCDSTNVFSEGHSGSEGDLYDSLVKIVKKSKAMVVVTTFASNIGRIQTLIDVARKTGRKLVITGYSLKRIITVSQESGYLDNKDDIMISEYDIKKYPRNELMVIATGCQGEENAGTAKIAHKTHKYVKLARGDKVIFSSKIIPGNEKKISDILNKLADDNIDVVTEMDARVHVSGHPNIDELKEMYKLVKPEIAIPVHGYRIHIKKHCELAEEFGVKKTVNLRNGDVFLLSNENPEILGHVESGYMAVDGNSLIKTDSHIIHERKKLQDSGVISISVVVDKQYNVLAKPSVQFYGIYRVDLAEEIADKIHKISHGKHQSIEKSIQVMVENAFKEEFNKSPIVLVSASIVKV